MLQKYGPLCIALVTLGSGCWNAIGAVGRLFPSLEILTSLFVVMSIPLALTFFAREVVAYNDEYSAPWFILAMLSLLGGSYLLTFHMDPNALMYLLVPLVQLFIAIPMRVALSRRRRTT